MNGAADVRIGMPQACAR